MVNPEETLIIVATYNERETLPQLVASVFAVAPAAELLVVDDNSPDGTGQWCEELARREPRLHCLHRPGKLGLGSALVEGLRFGIDRGYRYLITMDADLSHPPAKISELLSAMEPAEGPRVDVAIGSRYVKGGKIEGWPLHRHLMSRAINGYARWMLGLPVRDCSVNFRCYRAATLAQVDWSRIVSPGYAFFEEILHHLHLLGATFREIPITFTDRQHGRSKISLREGIRAIWLITRLGVQRRCRKFPGLSREA